MKEQGSYSCKKMARYILHTNNPQGTTTDELELIGQHATVLDRSRKALLVELDEADVNELADQLSGWSVQPEAIIPLPDTRKRLRK